MKRSVCLSHDPRSESHTVITGRSGAVTARSKDVADPDIIIPHPSGSRGGSCKLSHRSRKGIRRRGCVGTAVLVSGLQQSRNVRVGPQSYVFIDVTSVKAIDGEGGNMLVRARSEGRR